MSSEGSPVRRGSEPLDAAGLRVAIVVARFHGDVTERLLEGALAALSEHGASDEDIDVIRVPGAWELPQTAARVVATNRYDAIVTLGCVIRGETPHFGYVCQEATRGLGTVARKSNIPVLFGVLTTDDLAQAEARAGDGAENKGYETAIAAVEMVSVYRKLRVD